MKEKLTLRQWLNSTQSNDVFTKGEEIRFYYQGTPERRTTTLYYVTEFKKSKRDLMNDIEANFPDLLDNAMVSVETILKHKIVFYEDRKNSGFTEKVTCVIYLESKDYFLPTW